MKRLAVPGFVDLQVNGYVGVNFSDPQLDETACIKACNALLAHGTAAFLPTVITSQVELYRRNLPLLAKVLQRSEFKGRLLGLHLEGPFISPEPGAVGAHLPENVRDPDTKLVEQWMDWSAGTVKFVTLAAERPGACEVIRQLRSKNICVSLGHSLASEEQIAAACAAGATALTHLGNGIPNQLPRHPNPIWRGLAQDGLSALYIPDGHHLPASFIKVLLRAKGVKQSIVTSDTTMFGGMAPGLYEWGGQQVRLAENGRLDIPARGCLAGSAQTMLECMNFLASLKLLTLDEMLANSVNQPLELIGMSVRDLTATTELWYDENKLRFSVSGN